MSWFDLNYVFGESPGNNTNTFISESSEGSVVLDFSDGGVNDDQRRRSCPTFILITRNR
ncbi:hypothetical protein Hanom_Chr11g00974721 [Helianthus anomalus]